MLERPLGCSFEMTILLKVSHLLSFVSKTVGDFLSLVSHLVLHKRFD